MRSTTIIPTSNMDQKIQLGCQDLWSHLAGSFSLLGEGCQRQHAQLMTRKWREKEIAEMHLEVKVSIVVRSTPYLLSSGEHDRSWGRLPVGCRRCYHGLLLGMLPPLGEYGTQHKQWHGR
jgi:hypothetical protein